MTDLFTIQWEPLTEWPLDPTKPRTQPQFKATYDQTLKQLREELRAIDCKGPVALQVVTRNGGADLRRDGMLAQRATITHPGVRISFTSKFGATTIATDQFASNYYGSPPDWQANLRAIVLGLGALRAVDRYGIGSSGEQYRGWQQIGAATGPTSRMSREVASQILAEESGLQDYEATILERVKLAKKHAHPDRQPQGDRTRWDALALALEALGLNT